MPEARMRTQVKYVTNEEGKPIEVLVPFELWQQMLATLQDTESGLAWVDEHEPVTQLLTDLKSSLEHAAAGQTLPVEQLWQNLDD